MRKTLAEHVLSELSRGKLARYVKHASMDAADDEYHRGRDDENDLMRRDKDPSSKARRNGPYQSDTRATYNKRMKGVDRATARLAKD